MIPIQVRSLTEMRDNPRQRSRRKYANEPTMLDGMRFDSYIADFVHVDAKTGRTVVSDVKGAEPAVWSLKRALMLHVHGVEVVVVKA